MTKTEIQTMYEVMFTDYPDIVNVAQVQSIFAIPASHSVPFRPSIFRVFICMS